MLRALRAGADWFGVIWGVVFGFDVSGRNTPLCVFICAGNYFDVADQHKCKPLSGLHGSARNQGTACGRDLRRVGIVSGVCLFRKEVFDGRSCNCAVDYFGGTDYNRSILCISKDDKMEGNLEWTK